MCEELVTDSEYHDLVLSYPIEAQEHVRALRAEAYKYRERLRELGELD